MIHFTLAATDQELYQILDLQARNYKSELSPAEMLDQGFLSLKHEFKALKEISGKYKHIIAKDREKVAGFALVMLQHYRNSVPVLVPMFDEIDELNYQGRKLKDTSYVVMGQVCIDKDYRGSGLFKGLYQKLKDELSQDFEITVTEVATRNTRSMSAHEAVGFKRLKTYVSPEKEEWAIVYWDWK